QKYVSDHYDGTRGDYGKIVSTSIDQEYVKSMQALGPNYSDERRDVLAAVIARSDYLMKQDGGKGVSGNATSFSEEARKEAAAFFDQQMMKGGNISFSMSREGTVIAADNDHPQRTLYGQFTYGGDTKTAARMDGYDGKGNQLAEAAGNLFFDKNGH